MKAHLMMMVVAAATVLTGAAAAENIGSLSYCIEAVSIGPVTPDLEKNTFGYVDPVPRAAMLLSQEAQYIGRRTNNEEKDTFAFLELHPRQSARLQ
jgi:hypothetical protein